MRQWVLRVLFAAPDEEAAQKLGSDMIDPALRASALYWYEVQETMELQTMGEQAAAVLRDAAADDPA